MRSLVLKTVIVVSGEHLWSTAVDVGTMVHLQQYQQQEDNNSNKSSSRAVEVCHTVAHTHSTVSVSIHIFVCRLFPQELLS